LIAREGEFVRHPSKTKRARDFFAGFIAKKRGTGVAFLWLPFFGEAKKVTRR
jgi:hypothetical protein